MVQAPKHSVPSVPIVRAGPSLLHPPLSVHPELVEGRGGGKAAPSHIEESGGWNYWNDWNVWNRRLISLFRPLFLIENRAVLGSAALPARTRAKTSTVEFGILQVELDIAILLRIAEDVYRVLPRLDHFELVFQHTPIKYNAFVGKPQRFLGPVCDATLGDPCDHIFAAVVVQQRPLRLAGRVDARHGDVVKGYDFLGFPCVGTGVTGVPKMERMRVGNGHTDLKRRA